MATELYGQFSHKKHLIDGQLSVQGNDVRLKGGVTTDFPVTDGKVMPAGAVVVRKTADGLYYLANDGANGDRNTAASVASIEAPDADWKDKTLTWEVTYPDGTSFAGEVPASGNDDDTIAEWVALLNADPGFGGHLVASDSGAGDLLVITTRAKGEVHLSVSMDLDTAFESDDGGTSSDEDDGTEADYRVTDQQRSLINMNGASRDSDPVPTLLRGHFDESELTGLTDEAKSVLKRRGSIFG